MTQYMPILVRHDGEEYGILLLGDTKLKYQSIFPSDLFSYQKLHETYVEALDYLESIWIKITNKIETNAFYVEMVRQREYMTAEVCGSC
jgi:hypothetical protein